MSCLPGRPLARVPRSQPAPATHLRAPTHAPNSSPSVGPSSSRRCSAATPAASSLAARSARILAESHVSMYRRHTRINVCRQRGGGGLRGLRGLVGAGAGWDGWGVQQHCRCRILAAALLTVVQQQRRITQLRQLCSSGRQQQHRRAAAQERDVGAHLGPVALGPLLLVLLLNARRVGDGAGEHDFPQVVAHPVGGSARHRPSLPQLLGHRWRRQEERRREHKGAAIRVARGIALG